MENIYLHKFKNKIEDNIHCTIIEKNDTMKFICLCEANNDTLAQLFFRICNDQINNFIITHTDGVKIFTEILDNVNHILEKQYLLHSKEGISLFLWLLENNQIHFSMFGKNITGILVSENNIEDIISGMDTWEGRFVYDSHGDILHGETLYIISPAIDINIFGEECKSLGHLWLQEKSETLGKRIEKSYNNNGVIISIGIDIKSNPNKPQTYSIKKSNPNFKWWFENTIKWTQYWSKKIQESFYKLSHEAQNWSIIAGILMISILLYLIVTTLIKWQYTLFVPQKYRDIIAEARSDLDNATRITDQSENFGPALQKIREKILQVKIADVLKVDVELLEKDMAILEKTVNKVTTLKPEEFMTIFEFNQTIDALPFSIHVYRDKISLLTNTKIFWPFSPWETPKEATFPNNEKYLYSDIDTEGNIYVGTHVNKIYIFNNGIFSLQNIQQVGWWDRAKDINIYNSNIYLLSENRKQIYKHRRQSENTYAGKSLVINDEQIKNIIDSDIDGSVWILWGSNGSFSTEKILTAPKYERRSILINNLGINTIKDIAPETFKFFASEGYQEVYMLADNRIWVFLPSSKRFNDVQNITYIWQIDVPNTKITDIAIEQNGDIRKLYFGSTKDGVFMSKITIKDNKIVVLPTK